MDVNGLFDAPAALCQGKLPPIHIGLDVWWVSLNAGGKKNFLHLPGIEH